MNSMTGFGRGELERNGHSFVVEIKSVNHRISVTEGEAVQKVFTDNMERILSDTLADEGSVEMMEGYSKEWDINGIRAVFVIVKA